MIAFYKLNNFCFLYRSGTISFDCVEDANMKKPVIDLSDCILCGVCQDVCPEVFRLNDAGYIEVTEMPDYPRPCVDEAIKNCPADCIAWE